MYCSFALSLVRDGATRRSSLATIDNRVHVSVFTYSPPAVQSTHIHTASDEQQAGDGPQAHFLVHQRRQPAERRRRRDKKSAHDRAGTAEHVDYMGISRSYECVVRVCAHGVQHETRPYSKERDLG